MALKIKQADSPSPSPFSWDKLPHSPEDTASPPSPPTSWLSAQDMKIFGAEPLKGDIGVVRCKQCDKPVLRSAILDHAENCAKIRAGEKKGGKSKAGTEADEGPKKGKKRKADDDDPNPDEPKKKKAATKVTKGRVKGPVNYDKQCGVINDKGLPCSRSLTCKSHPMGAKRAVEGRSRPYDELLLQWNRENNPKFVEPVKKESKAERKERKEKEKAEKKKQAMEAAAAAGIDPTKKGSGAGTGTSGAKKGKKAAAAAAAAAVAAAAGIGPAEDGNENLDDIDSETEMDALSHAVRLAHDRGVLGVPLAVPCDVGSLFVVRRERLRNCRELVANALIPTRNGIAAGVAGGRLT